MNEVSALSIEDIQEGLQASFTTTISSEDIDTFAALTGDINPLHLDNGFAQSRGFRKRVAHGALLCGYVSRLFGVHLLGENCLLQNFKIDFVAPAYEGDTIELRATVEQISEAVGTIVVSVSVINTDTQEQLLRGRVQAGFTNKDE